MWRAPLQTLLLCCFLPVTLMAQSVGLPDTGQDLCYSGTAMVVCDETNTGDASDYPGQDGRFGRDAAAAAGQLTKVGGGVLGFDYTKVCNSGELADSGSCPADPALGSNVNEWGCTKDNSTGLMWEVKVNDNTHLRHSGWQYSWYNTDDTTNGGMPGTPDGSDNCLDNARCDTEKITADINAAGLCGHNDWRMPGPRELASLTHLGKQYGAAVDTDYFPNTIQNYYWSSAPAALVNASYAWWVSFFGGNGGRVDAWPMAREYWVRVVRGGQF